MTSSRIASVLLNVPVAAERDCLKDFDKAEGLIEAEEWKDAEKALRDVAASAFTACRSFFAGSHSRLSGSPSDPWP